MFFIDAKTYLDELEKFEPKILSSCREALEKSVIDLGFLKVNKQAFIKAPNKSIDYAVIERSKKVAVLPYEQQWRDLGSWDSVFEYLPADKNGNYLTGDVISSNTINTMIRSESRLVATSGVKDLLIVDTPDVILITKKNSAQEIKTLVQDLKKKNRIEATDNAKVHRPWGSYQSLCKGNNFQVKIIEVNPKKSLSLQLHNHRAEHWVVVNGTAEVINGDQKFILNENQSTFIPLGVKHRLTNPRNEKLKIIEVQSGTYLGEDDIIRFEDAHNRI